MTLDVLGGKPWDVLVGDSLAVLRGLPDACVHCAVTSPPYFGLRDYQTPGQLGLEAVPDCYGWATKAPCGECYVCRMVAVFREVRRVLRPDGTFWLNVGDSYANNPGNGRGGEGAGLSKNGGVPHRSARDKSALPGLKPKDLVGIPWLLAFALRADGWWLRGEQIWHKPNPMTESVRDRPARSHEQVFLFARSARYFYDAEAVRQPTAPATLKDRRKQTSAPPGYSGNPRVVGAKTTCMSGGGDTGASLRSVWKISVRGFKDAHFATFPPELPERCIRAGTSERGCCPACGAPWRRLVRKERRPTRPGKDVKYLPKSDGDAASAAAMGWNRPQVIGNRDPQRHCTVTETVGWEQGCKCPPAPTVPAIVLDPFAGSGTTLLVAKRLGRRGLGIELNAAYAEMARQRIAADVWPPRAKRARPAVTEPSLFDHLED